jgi:hypothetical protein
MDEEPTEEDKKEFDTMMKDAERTLYYSIGRSITAWSRTEGLLVIIAAMLLETSLEKAGLVLYSIINVNQWLSIIDELFAIDARYTPLRSNWADIAKGLRKLNDTRVRLAHNSVVRGKGIEVLVADGDVTEMYPSLKPNRYDVRSKSKSYPSLTMTELGDFVGDLGKVMDNIKTLLDGMYPIHGEDTKRLAEKLQIIKNEVLMLREAQKNTQSSTSSAI